MTTIFDWWCEAGDKFFEPLADRANPFDLMLLCVLGACWCVIAGTFLALCGIEKAIVTDWWRR